ncbi:uncharacterized protein [Arachis hypogaea]|uniref:uncharacterized protein n=1 Tax=Arachis hypogaea TaxID=3818 RepID=UPI0007AF7D7A
MDEAHEGVCGNHIGGISLASKVARAGYYWPTMKSDYIKKGFKIKHHFWSVEHPQSNGLAEAANKVILIALKKKLGDAKGEWADLIPEIMWIYNTTKQTTTKEIPYRLVYGADAMILVEIALTSGRAELTSTTNNNNIRQVELDTIEEDRYKAEIRHKAMQIIIKRKYNKKVKSR